MHGSWPINRSPFFIFDPRRNFHSAFKRSSRPFRRKDQSPLIEKQDDTMASIGEKIKEKLHLGHDSGHGDPSTAAHETAKTTTSAPTGD